MKKNPKIAVYICGQWRGSSYNCSEYLNKIFSQYDCDFFIHTFNFYNGKEMNFGELPNNINYKVTFINDTGYYYHTENDVIKIKESYPNLVYFEMDSKEKNDEIDAQFGKIVNMSSFNQFYGSYKCNEYRKIHENFNGFRYDVIIKIRPDIIFDEKSIDIIKVYIETIMNDDRTIFSKYENTMEYILNNKPTNLVWDHWIFSSPFGMDCMMEWVKDILDGKNTYSSDYILKYNLKANPFIRNVERADSFIVRELFKFFDLDYFYKKEFSYPWYHYHKKNLVNSINNLFYMNITKEEEKKLFYETYSIYDKLEEILNPKDIILEFDLPYHIDLNQNQLQELANHLKSKQHEYEEKLNNL